MARSSFRFKERLDGASNFLSWKANCLERARKELPMYADPAYKVGKDKKDVRAQRVIFDAEKDHLIPHVARKTTPKVFQSDNLNRKMVLKNKLLKSRIIRFNNVISYLTQICDQLATVGERIVDVELVNVALNGFTKPWESFVKGIYTQENILDIN